MIQVQSDSNLYKRKELLKKHISIVDQMRKGISKLSDEEFNNLDKQAIEILEEIKRLENDNT